MPCRQAADPSLERHEYRQGRLDLRLLAAIPSALVAGAIVAAATPCCQRDFTRPDRESGIGGMHDLRNLTRASAPGPDRLSPSLVDKRVAHRYVLGMRVCCDMARDRWD